MDGLQEDAREPAPSPDLSLIDRLTIAKDRLVKAADYEGAAAVRAAIERLSAVTDEKPSPQVRTVMKMTPVTVVSEPPVTPKGKYGGPYDDAADERAAKRGMRVKAWRAWKAGEWVIDYTGPESNPDFLEIVKAEIDSHGLLAYIVEPLPKAEPVKPAEAKASIWIPREQIGQQQGEWFASVGPRHNCVQCEVPIPPAPVVKRIEVNAHYGDIDDDRTVTTRTVKIPLSSIDGKTDLDRERIALEYLRDNRTLVCNQVEIADRLAEIERGEP